MPLYICSFIITGCQSCFSFPCLFLISLIHSFCFTANLLCFLSIALIPPITTCISRPEQMRKPQSAAGVGGGWWKESILVFVTAPVVIFIKTCIRNPHRVCLWLMPPVDYSGKFDQKLNLMHATTKLHHFREFFPSHFRRDYFHQLNRFLSILLFAHFVKILLFLEPNAFYKPALQSHISPSFFVLKLFDNFSCFVQILFTKALIVFTSLIVLSLFLQLTDCLTIFVHSFLQEAALEKM